jgi:hypothetical protein
MFQPPSQYDVADHSISPQAQCRETHFAPETRCAFFQEQCARVRSASRALRSAGIEQSPRGFPRKMLTQGMPKT